MEEPSDWVDQILTGPTQSLPSGTRPRLGFERLPSRYPCLLDTPSLRLEECSPRNENVMEVIAHSDSVCQGVHILSPLVLFRLRFVVLRLPGRIRLLSRFINMSTEKAMKLGRFFI
jgi:hypothetical protein